MLLAERRKRKKNFKEPKLFALFNTDHERNFQIPYPVRACGCGYLFVHLNEDRLSYHSIKTDNYLSVASLRKFMNRIVHRRKVRGPNFLICGPQKSENFSKLNSPTFRLKARRFVC